MLKTNLEKIIAYICQQYPYKDELSDARLTKMVYLTDWFSSLVDDKQATEIKWLFNHYGPYVPDIYQVAKDNGNFVVKTKSTVYGNHKKIIDYIGDDKINLEPLIKSVIDKVIDKTKSMYFNDFIDYVYSTYPVKNNDRYSILDLPRLAHEYRASIT
jgi:uncharacterized phage-associated protein